MNTLGSAIPEPKTQESIISEFRDKLRVLSNLRSGIYPAPNPAPLPGVVLTSLTPSTSHVYLSSVEATHSGVFSKDRIAKILAARRHTVYRQASFFRFVFFCSSMFEAQDGRRVSVERFTSGARHRRCSL